MRKGPRMQRERETDGREQQQGGGCGGRHGRRRWMVRSRGENKRTTDNIQTYYLRKSKMLENLT